MEILVSLIQIMIKGLLQNFAHDRTAMLSWNEQKVVAIRGQGAEIKNNLIDTEF